MQRVTLGFRFLRPSEVHASKESFSRVHQKPWTPEPLPADSRVVFQGVLHRLFGDLVGPTGLKQSVERKEPDEIADGRGRRRAGI
jgi:hypothetical protein